MLFHPCDPRWKINTSSTEREGKQEGTFLSLQNTIHVFHTSYLLTVPEHTDNEGRLAQNVAGAVPGCCTGPGGLSHSLLLFPPGCRSCPCQDCLGQCVVLSLSLSGSQKMVEVVTTVTSGRSYLGEDPINCWCQVLWGRAEEGAAAPVCAHLPLWRRFAS